MTEQLTRTFTLDRKAGKGNCFPAVAATETPVQRHFGYEVLDMSRMDLSRAPLPVIESHDQNTLNIGVFEDVRIEGDKLRGSIRLGNSARAKEVAEDIKAGIVRNVSVGYNASDPVEDGEIDGVPVFRFAAAVHELSLVAAPADINSGIYRSKEKIMQTDEKLNRSEHKRANQDGQTDQERIAAIQSMANRHDLHGLGMKAIAEGWSLQDFNERAMTEVTKRNESAKTFTAGGGDEKPDQLSMEMNRYDRALEDYSLTRLLRSLVDPKQADKAGLELEISQDMQRVLGREVEGVMVPYSALQARSVTYGGTGSNAVATDHLAGNFIDVLRNKSHIMSLGPNILRGLVGNVAIPRKSAGASAYWIAGDDGDSVTASDPTLDQVTMSPNTVGGLTTFSHRMLIQASPDIENMVRQDLADMIAVEIDAKAIAGDGTGNTPVGVMNQTGVNTQAFAAADPSYAELVGMETKIADDNADTERMVYLTTPSLREHFKTTSRQTAGVEGNFIWDTSIGSGATVNGYRCLTSKNVPAGNVILADWSQLLIGFWGGIEIMADPYGTNFAKGSVSIRILADVDIAVRHPQAFCIGSN